MVKRKDRDQHGTGLTYPRPEHRFSNARIGMTYAQSSPDYPAVVEAPHAAPNVVVVILDDAGYGVSSAYGGPVRTPVIERLCREGIQYCSFHTAALCAPTRASLLTGRNHHTVSSGVVAELGTGYPGYTGIVPKSCAFISEILSQNGYATGFWGKNHNVPDNRTSAAGPFDNWPTRRGFDYFYGFLGGMTDQFYPALYRDTVPVEANKKPEDGYHLTTDLVDDCIEWMRTQKSIAPQRPFFVHVAPGAVHGPHQPPLSWRGRNEGRFAMGWDRLREETYERQRELGVIARGTKLTSRPPEIPAWSSFSESEQVWLARQMENFADFHEHTDYEIGRLVDAIESMGELDNTLIIYLLGDNGSSAEGGLTGTMNETATMSGLAPPIENGIARVDELGLPGTSPHYAVGWAWAGDTPFKWMKQVASHFGGTRNGLVITWPAWIADAGSKRFQFHHVIDIVPTILDVVGIDEPTSVNGVTQKPIEGMSMAYTFDRENADAPTTHSQQYFEMLGNRAVYRDGWMACCRHGRLPWQSGTADFNDDRWELYNIDEDFSQAEDLAEQRPELLAELKDVFLVEAARHDVLPLDDRFVERMDVTLRPGFFTGRATISFAGRMARLPEGSAPRTSNVDHTIKVFVRVPEQGAEGVLVCMGGDWAGWSLFVSDDRLRYHYNWYDLERYDVVATETLPRGKDVELSMEFLCDDASERGAPATVRLFSENGLVSEGRILKQVRGRFSEGLDIGEDRLSPVYPAYRDRLPFRFTGEIMNVVFELEQTAPRTAAEILEEELRAD